VRSSPVHIHPEELLPDVTRRVGAPIRFSSTQERLAFEARWQRLDRIIANIAATPGKSYCYPEEKR
jgi:hypothetical protein